jgi:hypothetical protein
MIEKRERLLEKFTELNELFKDPKKWTKGYYAKFKGVPCRFSFSRADCFCLVGGCARVNFTYTGEPDLSLVMTKCLRQTVEAPSLRSLLSWNDRAERTHEEVIAAINTTIQNIKDGKCDGILEKERVL